MEDAAPTWVSFLTGCKASTTYLPQRSLTAAAGPHSPDCLASSPRVQLQLQLQLWFHLQLTLTPHTPREGEGAR